MNKWVKATVFFFGTIIVLWLVGRMTNALQYFNNPSPSNYPTITEGEHFFASNLVKPRRFDFIVYRMETPELEKQLRVHRLVGLPGDSIQIKGGELLINGAVMDTALTLAHFYFIGTNDLPLVEKYEQVIAASAVSKDSTLALLADQTVQQAGITARRFVLPAGQGSEEIVKVFGKSWTADDFGPVKVPKGKYFVMGDNRQNAQDSRYLGFIDQADWVATVLGK